MNNKYGYGIFTLLFLVLEKFRTSYAAGGMAGQRPFNFNQTGSKLLPLLGSPLVNPQQLLSQLQGLRAPQSNMGLGSLVKKVMEDRECKSLMIVSEGNCLTLTVERGPLENHT